MRIALFVSSRAISASNWGEKRKNAPFWRNEDYYFSDQKDELIPLAKKRTIFTHRRCIKSAIFIFNVELTLIAINSMNMPTMDELPYAYRTLLLVQLLALFTMGPSARQSYNQSIFFPAPIPLSIYLFDENILEMFNRLNRLEEWEYTRWHIEINCFHFEWLLSSRSKGENNSQTERRTTLTKMFQVRVQVQERYCVISETLFDTFINAFSHSFSCILLTYSLVQIISELTLNSLASLSTLISCSNSPHGLFATNPPSIHFPSTGAKYVGAALPYSHINRYSILPYLEHLAAYHTVAFVGSP